MSNGASIGRDGDEALPRILYIGDVPVSNTVAGGVFFFRLFRNYPPHKLVICAPQVDGGPRLPGVRYISLDARWPRLFRSRVSRLYCAWIAWRQTSTPAWLQRVVRECRPQLVVSIAHTSGWITAFSLAQSEKLPLFLFVHDDHAFSFQLPAALRPWAERRFAQAYQGAAERFCISQAMEELYSRRYGVAGRVRYPIRDVDVPPAARPARQASEQRLSLTFVYAGSYHGGSGLRQILDFAREAGRFGHKLVVYSPQSENLLKEASGIANLESRAPLGPAKLAEKLRDEADCLLLIGSFDSDQKAVLETAFPTKAADYSAIGVPLIVWAPTYASIVRFVEKHPGIAELVTDRDPTALARAMARLADSPELRTRLARSILDIGAQYFSPESAWVDFSTRLRGAVIGGDAR